MVHYAYLCKAIMHTKSICAKPLATPTVSVMTFEKVGIPTKKGFHGTARTVLDPPVGWSSGIRPAGSGYSQYLLLNT